MKLAKLNLDAGTLDIYFNNKVQESVQLGFNTQILSQAGITKQEIYNQVAKDAKKKNIQVIF